MKPYKVKKNYLFIIDLIISIYILDPILPSLLIIRENYGRYCETTLQHKILESSLYNDMNILNFDIDGAKCLDFLKENSIFEEKEKESLLQARWYILNESSNFLDSKKNSLLRVYQLLYFTLGNYVESISQYFISLENPFDLLQEYCAFWARYTHSIFEIERLFKDFTSLINESYEKEFKEFPSFPKFSILRLMIKIWINKVLENNKEKLLEAFEIAIHELRRRKRDFSDSLFDEKYNNFEKSSVEKENFYKNDAIALGQLIRSFFNCLTDSSINELTIHHLGHSDVNSIIFFFFLNIFFLKIKLTNPFTDFHNRFIKISGDYYKNLGQLFRKNPVKLEQLLKEDVEFFKTMMNEKVMKSLKQIKHKIWLMSFSDMSRLNLIEIENNDCELMSPLPNMNKEIGKNLLTIFEKNVNLLISVEKYLI